MSAPLQHRDGKIGNGMRYAIAIMSAYFPNGLEADTTDEASRVLVKHLRRPSRLGRTPEQQCAKMKSSVEVAIGRKLLRFSGNRRLVEITPIGTAALQECRAGRAKCSQRYVNKRTAA